MEIAVRDRAKDIAELLKILGNENRILILCYLIDKPKTVGSLGKFIPNIIPIGPFPTPCSFKGSQNCRLVKSRTKYNISHSRQMSGRDNQSLKKHYCEEKIYYENI